ncbi:MAG: hypothetical protein RJA70_4902, partial [Pseudomonadota bacterium]
LETGCLLTLTLKDTTEAVVPAPFAPFHRTTFVLERFWSLEDAVRRGVQDPIRDEREAVDQLEAALVRSVKLQSIADVPLGAFLSGGIDSSTIAALMQRQGGRPVRTFTIGLNEAGFNEAVHAKAVAKHLGTDHTELYVTSAEAQAVIPRLRQLYSEPFADASQIPTHLVAEMARQHVTVALSGDAGDELFGGYNRYFWGKRIWNRIGWMPQPARRTLGGLIRQVPVGAWDTLGRSLPGARRIARLGDKAHKLAHRLRTVDGVEGLYRSLVTEWPADSQVVPGAVALPTRLDDAAAVEGITEPAHRMMIWDTLTYLPDDILHKVDRAAMGVSLETRVPFLDHRVAELAWRFPLAMKLRDGQGKWVLREVLYRHVPRALIDRPKAGFGLPINLWLRGPLRAWAESLMAEDRLKREGYFDSRAIRERWFQHQAGTHDWTPALWAVLMFQAWLEGETN